VARAPPPRGHPPPRQSDRGVPIGTRVVQDRQA
jgi:hypothetical protein